MDVGASVSVDACVKACVYTVYVRKHVNQWTQCVIGLKIA